ncbi:hypothetical protein H4Q26_005398 [Puccinia striiformis f. sp. tritici PST-130]|nr:hypothetical protein H4Q26_005398 [Puccinia striiformis f. sp. tritici PST-130]
MSGKAQLVRKTANRARERLSNARQGRIRSPNGWELRKRPTRRGRNRLRNGWAEAGQTVCQEKIPRQAARSPAVYPASASDNRQGIGIQLRTREIHDRLEFGLTVFWMEGIKMGGSGSSSSPHPSIITRITSFTLALDANDRASDDFKD